MRSTLLRDVEKINIPILLVYESVFRVASMGTDNRYAPIDAPRKRIQILRNIGILIFSTSLRIMFLGCVIGPRSIRDVEKIIVKSFASLTGHRG